MGKNKLRRFAEVKLFDHFFEPSLDEAFELCGKWREKFFKNNHPIVLELGCGKGEYSVGLGRHQQEKNFIGVDIKGSRMYIGAVEAMNEGLQNVAFLRTKIEFIDRFFAESEVDEIWLTFSDPQPKKPRKRLTSPFFIERYRKILKQGGLIHLKTDSDVLFEYTEEQIIEHGYKCELLTWDLYNERPEKLGIEMQGMLHIKTHYEKLFTSKGSTIKYCRFRIS